MQGGLVSLGWLLISCIVASWTGKLLVACAQKMDFFNYPRLGHLVSGKNGEYIVVLFITLEFIGIVCCKTIFMWGHLDLLMQLLGFDVSELTYIFFSTALVCTTFFKVNVSEFAALVTESIPYFPPDRRSTVVIRSIGTNHPSSDFRFD